jgi:hypothetical protein
MASSTQPAQATPAPIQVKINPERVGGKPRAFVDPPDFGLGNAPYPPSVQLINNTSDTAWLWFPNGYNLFDAPAGYPDYANPIEIGKNGGTVTLPVKTGGPANGLYHYHVYCETVKECARGQSEPTVHVP